MSNPTPEETTQLRRIYRFTRVGDGWSKPVQIRMWDANIGDVLALENIGTANEWTYVTVRTNPHLDNDGFWGINAQEIEA